VAEAEGDSGGVGGEGGPLETEVHLFINDNGAVIACRKPRRIDHGK